MTIEHTGCTLAIVGSRDVPRYAAESKIREAIQLHLPKMVISGGAKGIDTFAVEIAEEIGDILTVEFVPRTPAWRSPAVGDASETILPNGRLRVIVPGGFQERNLKVAEACDCLVRISSETTHTYGSGWTADQAEKMGKNVIRHVVTT